jgi:hypothetical protein
LIAPGYWGEPPPSIAILAGTETKSKNRQKNTFALRGFFRGANAFIFHSTALKNNAYQVTVRNCSARFSMLPYDPAGFEPGSSALQAIAMTTMGGVFEGI